MLVGAEVFTWLAAVSFVVFCARPAFVLGQATIGHDNLYWFYPAYQHFAETLAHGEFPYWDPYSHGGRPFYPVLLQLRLLEPVSYAVLAVLGFLTDDLVTLFNWDRLARGLVGALGAGVLLRQWATHAVTRLLLPVLLVWSSHLLAGFQQTAVIDQYVSAPWVAYFALKVAHDGDARWRNWIGLGVFLGLGWQSYYFAGAWLLLLFLGAGLLTFRRAALVASLHRPGTGRRALVAGALVTLMALPNAVVFSERGDAVFPARMTDHDPVGRRPLGGPLQYEPPPTAAETGIGVMTYPLVQYTGTFSSGWDFVQLLAPDGNVHARGRGDRVFGAPSEAFMYVGLLGYLGALIGAVVAVHPLKRVWLASTVGFGLLMLGPAGGLHRLLWLLPALWVVRHTHAFVSFFVLGLFYFFVIGCDHTMRWLQRGGFQDGLRVLRAELPARLLAGISGLTLVFVAAAEIFLQIERAQREVPITNWEALIALVVLVAGIAGRRLVGGIGLIVSVLLAHVVVVMGHAWNRSELAIHMVVFLALPVAAILVCSAARPVVRSVVAGAAAVMLAFDLGSYVVHSEWLWHWTRPDHALGSSSRPLPPAMPATRVLLAPAPPPGGLYSQPIRYSSLVTRTAAAFSTPMEPAPAGDDLERVRAARRWNSFLIPRRYFELVHSRLPGPALEAILGIGDPLLQIRTTASSGNRAVMETAVRGLSGDEARRWFTDRLYVDTPIPESGPAGPRSTGSVRVARYRHNALEATIETPSAGYLYVIEGFDVHWTARVDGAPAPVVPANAAFLGVPVPAGPSTVSLEYRPVPMQTALCIYFGTAAAGLAFVAAAPLATLLRSRAANVTTAGGRAMETQG